MFESISPLGGKAFYDPGGELFNIPVRLLYYNWDTRKYSIKMEDGTITEASPKCIKLHPFTKVFILDKDLYGYSAVVDSVVDQGLYRVFILGKCKHSEINFSKVVSME